MMLLQFLMKVMLYKLLAQVNLFFLFSVQRQNILYNLLWIQVERLITSVIVFVITVDGLCCEANCYTLLGGG